MKQKKVSKKVGSPTIVNRRASRDFAISETLECGIELQGSEVKSIRNGSVSIAEGWIKADENPIELTLYGVHISEYPPAPEHLQHDPNRSRKLLAHKREIKKLAEETRPKGWSLIPLKMYFVRGRVKILVGLGQGKSQVDKREKLAKKDDQRQIERELRRKR